MKNFNSTLKGESLSSIKSDDGKLNVSVASTKVEYNNLAEYLKETHPLFHHESIKLCEDLVKHAKLIKVS